MECGKLALSVTVENGAGPRVLVVDDEESILEFLELGLRYEGFQVELAVDGPAALAMLDRMREKVLAGEFERSLLRH